ncbi:hypothetical protein MJO28_001008 [Puccinia striiformis f. sp. tritici]|nr:hypothetical protein Pst134EA_000243 [Puccinia striiformis f. sp. tritici]KAI9599970.1 hypothetical protein KEM48_000084 [Puccinia striiformis f. sp. tritici PST-130]KNF01898.1 hypothetical protein PSTG_05015 [Puccinia striiformis f. sp. tritici PST-78]POW23305.1 hypothetical protein PSHT_00333 [Puccinia striiformis]KAH9466401.1 hypothetical protein Pst134EB_001457 [Puccinia striiformis f. sp. tritici]KAH9473165.1 hypothetical protein Pst134EA_000243 [Puccinia striiformis f. sp. tritici]
MMISSNVSSKEKLPQYYHPNNTASSTIKSRTISTRLLPSIILFSVLLSLPIFLFFHYTWNHQPSSSTHLLSQTNPFSTPSSSSSPIDTFKHPHDPKTSGSDLPKLGELIPSKETLKGGTIMPKMANATAKAELGRATWKFMHTMTARFPEKPTADEREALKAFIYLFSRLYPCGDCARHFQELLKQYPPQTSSRNVASLHLCSLHNLVNERLGKPEYNCTSLLENYDCGCGHDEKLDPKQSSTSFLNTVPLMTPAF